MNQTYINAVRLLLAVAPVVFRKPVFALKGGTAINLFLRDMPRLSVDLDLVYADHRLGLRDAEVVLNYVAIQWSRLPPPHSNFEFH